jgi:hypothetical protein
MMYTYDKYFISKNDQIMLLYFKQFESQARDRYETFLQKEEEIKEKRNSVKVKDNKEKNLPQLKAENAILQQQALKSKELKSLESQKGKSICNGLIHTFYNALNSYT